jgi:meso-butanediol dehydrogenase/(S,S)-butanediol dehydrogenase/diacetyl reductase
MRMNALVTGAGSGIGTAIARELAGRGFTVGVTDVSESAAATVADSLGMFHTTLDVTSAASVREAATLVEAELGPISVWVCNAGVSSMGRFVDLTLAEWNRMFAVNSRGVFLCGREAARRMIGNRVKGAIINIASMAGKQGRVPYLAHYVASKFAVVGLTQAMALELAEFGIRVNAVCPGFVATSMQEREVKWEAQLRGITEEQVLDAYVRDTPMGRLELPEDVARVVAFLAGPDAGFITGEAVSVNGGAYMD